MSMKVMILMTSIDCPDLNDFVLFNLAIKPPFFESDYGGDGKKKRRSMINIPRVRKKRSRVGRVKFT